MADGTSYQIELKATGTETFQSAAEAATALSDRLAAAGSAATAAANDVVAAAARYASAEAAADSAAKAVERIGIAADAQRGKLQAAMDSGDASKAEAAAAKLQTLVAKQADATTAATAAAAALKVEGAALDALKGKASAAEQAEKELGAATKKATKDAEIAAKATEKAAEAAKGSGKFGDFAEGIGKLGGPLGGIASKAKDVSEGFSKLGGSMGASAGLALGAAAAVAALVAGLVVGTVAIAQWAVGLADANRTAGLMVQAVAASSESLAGLGSIMPGVTKATGIAGEQLTGLAQNLDAAKVSAEDMPAALKAIATAEAALKGSGAGFVADLKSGKKSVAEVAAEVDSKFGGIVKKRMLGLDAQSDQLGRNIGEIFGGLNIESLLEGFAKLVGFFDSSTASGETLKFLFESIFQPLVDAAASSIPKVERFMLGIAIGALKVYIALKPAVKAVGEFFGADVNAELPDVLKLGEYAAYAIAGAIGLLVIGVIAVAAAFAILAAPVLLFYGALVGLVVGVEAAYDWLNSKLPEALTAVETAIEGARTTLIEIGEKFSQVGSELIDGLVKGIEAGAGAVLSAITGVVQGGIDAAKALLHISSPSKVFAEMGGYTAEGFAEGVEDGTPAVQGSLESMVTPPDAPGVGGGGDTTHGGTYYFTIQVKADGNADSIASAIRREVTSVLEGMSVQLGGGEVPAT